MKLENQLSNQELSKKMEELGFEQESTFYWFKKNDGLPFLIPAWEILDNEKKDVVSAYTVSELGEMLKEKCPMAIEGETLVDGKWEIDGLVANTEADVRAKMLIYLRENKLL